MENRFTKYARAALSHSMEAAGKLGHTCIGSEHLLLGILSEKDCIGAELLKNRNITYSSMHDAIKEHLGSGAPTELSASDMTPRTQTIIKTAAYEAAKRGGHAVGTEHILLAILMMRDCVACQLLSSAGVDIAALGKELLDFIQSENEPANAENGENASERVRERSASPSLRGMENLSKYGKDLTALAKEKKLDPVIGRDTETERLIQILSRRTKNNPCLIGEPGVGKTAVVEGLAQRIIAGNVPEDLKDRIIVTLDVSGMLAGTKYRGEFEERLKGVMDEVIKNPKVILFIDEIHTIVGAGATSEGSMDAANIIKPALSRGEFQVIGATTLSEYRKHIEKDAALERRFQSVTVGEPSPEDAVKILFGLRARYEEHHKLKISDEALNAAVKLSRRYIGDRYLPDKAIDLIDEAASRKRIGSAAKPDDLKELEEKIKQASDEKRDAIVKQDFEKAAELRDRENELNSQLEKLKTEWEKTKSPDEGVVTESDIADIVTQWTGIPVKKLATEEGERLLRLGDLLHERVIGQDEAVEAVAKAIRRSRIGLKDPNRPSGSFIFLGPTGVGKTELSKALAEILFGDENAMIRIDMSEYMEKASVSKMIGSPPGYVGYEEGGQLTEKIRRKPYSVLLFDEIEKAHPDVFNILLQVLEDGRLTDSQGRQVDFKNTVIILTSNVGAGEAAASKALGFVTSSAEGAENERREQMMRALRATFRPEFLNRVDEVILFNSLSKEDIAEIAKLMLDEVTLRCKGIDISLSFTPAVAQLLAQKGFDANLGARPLRRTVTRLVEDVLSSDILEGKFAAKDRIEATVVDEKVVFLKK